MSERLKIRVQESPERGGFSLWGFVDYPLDRPRSVVISLMMDQREAATILDPFVTIERAAAQQLLDDLWNAGLRPAEARTTGEHLTDLRKIAFAALKKIGLDL